VANPSEYKRHFDLAMVCVKQLSFWHGRLKDYAVAYLDTHAAHLTVDERTIVIYQLSAHNKELLDAAVPCWYWNGPIPPATNHHLLHLMIGYGWRYLIQCLDRTELKKLAKTRDSLGRTPLMYTMIGRQDDTVVHLIDQGVDVNARDNLGRTALSHASRSCCIKVVKTLISCGADVNLADNHTQTPLFHTLNLGVVYRQPIADMLTVMRALLVPGINTSVDLANYRGETALIAIARQDCLSRTILEMLYNFGASVNLSDSNGQTALIHIIRNSSKSGSSGFWEKFTVKQRYKNAKSAMFSLLKAGAVIDQADNYGRTALWWAAEGRHGQAVAILVEAGADIHLADAEGQTPWSFAVIPGWLERSAMEMINKKYPGDFSSGQLQAV
jgi:ankyrin repeat protein